MDFEQPTLSTDILGQNDATVRVRPQQAKGLVFRVNLFYLSETWISLLHADVKSLLDEFVTQYSESIPSTSEIIQKSPVEIFKKVWIEKGWSHIHALGVGDGSAKRDFGESVFRAFLEQLYDGVEPIRQMAVLLAIYTFYSTQPRSALKTRIPTDSLTLEHLIRLPEILSQGSNPIRERRDNGFDAGDDAVINETLDSDSQLSPADDIKFILYSLFSADAFFVIPSQVYLFPPLPSVNILDSRNKTKEQSAKVLLATEQEMKLLQNGKLQTLIPDLESFDHWTPKLREAEAAYVAEKYNGFTSIFQTPLTQSIINRGQEMTYNTIKRLKEDDTNVSSTKAGTEDFSAFASKDLFGLVASHGLSSVATSFEETLARMETE